MSRRRMTLAGQLLVLQLLIVLAVLVVVGAIGLAQTTRDVERSEGREALSAAENLAAQPIVRERIGVAEPGLDAALAAAGEANRSVSGASVVAIAAPDLTVLASSDPTLVDIRLPLGESDVLEGRSWNGVLTINGESTVVAHVPVQDGEMGEMIGVVMIGRDLPTTLEQIVDAAPSLLAYLGVATLLGVAGSFLLSRRIKRQTMGLEPTEIAGLVEHREAMLHGIKEGVIALDRAERITLVNDSGLKLLGLTPDCVGKRLGELDLDRQVREVLTSDQSAPDRLVLVEAKVLAFNRMPLRTRSRVIGSVTTLRDRTELSSLEKELSATRTTSDTLRAQTHEFANQLHTISGLLQLEEYDEVLRFVSHVRDQGTKVYNDVTAHVQDPTVAALLIAKSSLATERGVDLELDGRTRVTRLDDDLSRDLATVVGNLVDNAFDAVGSTSTGQVRVLMEEDDSGVVVTVRDSGAGVAAHDAERVFTQGYSTKDGSAADGRGFGLALTRLVCRRRGGDVTVHNEPGAVFTARLPKQHALQGTPR